MKKLSQTPFLTEKREYDSPARSCAALLLKGAYQMFGRKIAALALVALTLTACSQLMDFVGLGTKPTPVRQTRTEHTPAPVEPTPTPAPQIFYSPSVDPKAGTATFPPATFATQPTARPDGTFPVSRIASPSLTARVTDLGDGVKEVGGFKAPDWAPSMGDLGDRVEVAAVTTDPGGSVYILAERMCTSCYSWFEYSYPSTRWEGVFKLEAFASDSATFSLVADKAGQEDYVNKMMTVNFGSVDSYRWDRLVAFRTLSGLATSSVDLHHVGTTLSGENFAVLSEDAEARWGTASMSTPLIWRSELNRSLGNIADPPLGSAMSVGANTILALVKDGNLVQVLRHGQSWRQLTVPGPRPWVKWDYQHDHPGQWQVFEDSWEASWEYCHTWYSPRWPEKGGHWIWAGHATSPRLWMLPDK